MSSPSKAPSVAPPNGWYARPWKLLKLLKIRTSGTNACSMALVARAKATALAWTENLTDQ